MSQITDLKFQFSNSLSYSTRESSQLSFTSLAYTVRSFQSRILPVCLRTGTHIQRFRIEPEVFELVHATLVTQHGTMHFLDCTLVSESKVSHL